MTPSRRSVNLIPSTYILSLLVGAVLVVAAMVPAVASASFPYTIESFTSRTTDSAEVDYTAAGGHPFQNRTGFEFSNHLINGLGQRYPNEELKDSVVTLAPGFIGNPAAANSCPIGAVADSEAKSGCPPGSRVGTVELVFLGGLGVRELPVYNLIPELGYPAQFGFKESNFITVLSVVLLPRSESYGLTVGSRSVTKVAHVISFTATFCSFGAAEGKGPAANSRCKAPSSSLDTPFLSNPLDCSDPQPTWKLAADSWENAGTYLANGLPDLTNPGWLTDGVLAPPVSGCEDPLLAAQFDSSSITTKPLQPGGGPVQADQPSGLAVDLDFPQANDPTDPNTNVDNTLPQTPEPKDITVKLPSGLAISPSSADGLQACSDLASDPAGDQVHYDNTKPVSCPDASKIGSAVATSPLLALRDPLDDHIIGAEPIPGDVYLLKPHPGDLPVGGGSSDGKFRLLIQLENPGAGINIKLPGIAVADKHTGQLTATFADNPQLPASTVQVELRSGPRAPLSTPVTCGKFTSTSDIIPWSTPGTPDANPTADFSVTSGPNRSPCPASTSARPFNPALTAGAESGAAGQASPFDLRFTRKDGEGEFSLLEATLPKGLTASLRGVPYCSDAAIAAAGGTSAAIEKASPSCPPASQIGHVTVAAGASTTPYYVTGKIYLAGPDKGAPLSLVVIVPALAGSFDLGTAVVRAALEVDPETAQITARSDALPRILDGVPLRLRSIDLALDRPHFTINPTNCEPMAVEAAVAASGGATATSSAAFSVGGCARLGFEPKLTLKLLGPTQRSAHPALRVGLFARPGDANIRRAALTLPTTELLESSHFRHVCSRVRFDAGSCPQASVYGRAEARIPLLDQALTGPVYLRANPASGLPDLVASLDGQIHLDVVAHIDSTPGRIRTTFDTPDIALSSFRVKLFGGARGLVVNSGGVCGAPRGRIDLRAQNGRVFTSRPKLQAACAKSGRKAKGGWR